MKKETDMKKEEDKGVVEMLQVTASVIKNEQLFIFTLPYGFKFDSALEAVKEISDLLVKRSEEYKEHVKKQQEAAKAKENQEAEKVEEKKEVSK